MQLKHTAAIGSYSRDYHYDDDNNQLKTTTIGAQTYYYDKYDASGNMLIMPHINVMNWNASNELCSIQRGNTFSYYQYSSGHRIRKYTDKGSLKEERIYLGGYEIYRTFDSSGSLKLERSTVHTSDDTGRIAMLETRNPRYQTDDSPAVLNRYIYSNHSQSASLELNEKAEIISYEEYHPYGTTSYQGLNAKIKACAKRYCYTDKERDEKSGL